MASSQLPLRGSRKNETKELAESSNSASGWTFFPPLPHTGEADTPNPPSHSSATTRWQSETGNIQQRKQEGRSHVTKPANARLTDRTSSSTTLPIINNKSSAIQEKLVNTRLTNQTSSSTTLPIINNKSSDTQEKLANAQLTDRTSSSTTLPIVSNTLSDTQEKSANVRLTDQTSSSTTLPTVSSNKSSNTQEKSVNTQLTDQTSSSTTLPTVSSNKSSNTQEKSARVKQRSHKHMQEPGVYHEELNRNTAGKCRMDDLPESRKDCSEPRTTFQHGVPSPAFPRVHQDPLPALPRISSGPSLVQSFENVLPSDVATQLIRSSSQHDHTGSHEHEHFPKREARPASEQAPESFSNTGLGYIPKERASSIGDGATSLPTIPETPYEEEVRRAAQQTDRIAHGNTRRNSRQMIGQVLVTTDAPHAHKQKQKQEDSPKSKSESYYRSDSRSSSQTCSSSASEWNTDESSTFVSQSAGHKPRVDSPSQSLLPNHPQDDARRSGYLEDKYKSPAHPKRDSETAQTGHVENKKSHHIPQIQTQKPQKPSNSAKPRPDCMPPQTQTQTQTETESTNNAPVPPLRKDLLPPWAVGSAALSRNQ
ncbi:hypothetical protein Plec18167_009628 [Paecilomyces lecythidis]|uniref:Uncharacterized protein n=1 Tax=Paecilomyces lecythidis TaxID=3004212 RepID=A0ABR3WMD4_9EURO